MNLRDKHDALLALRPFVRTLPIEQIALFHQIATRYRGPAEGFRDAVMTEFRQVAAVPPVDELELRLSVIRALGGGAQLAATVERVKTLWPQLSPAAREGIVSDVETAIAYAEVAGADLPLWRQIRALAETTAATRPALDEQRLAAAHVAYASYEFGCPVVVDRAVWQRSPSGREWKLPILVATGSAGESLECGQFVVRFEDLTDVTKEAYGILNGRILAPAQKSVAL